MLIYPNKCQQSNKTRFAARRLVPTNLGVVLVHGYQKIDRDLVEFLF
jgi:DNA topoisomerase-3